MDESHAGEPAVLSELQVLAMAAGAWGAALLAAPVPLALAVAISGSALVVRAPRLVVVGVILLSSGLAHRADIAYRPVEPGPFSGPITLVDDPRPVGAGWRADVALPDGRRVQASGFGSAGHALGRRTAGDQLEVRGTRSTIDDRPWARARHLVGRLQVSSVEHASGPGGLRGVVESLRQRVVAGGDALPERLRPLYLGLVVGEDRLQSPAQRARFEAAGLTHLLAVSGQNVAFVLAAVRPFGWLLGRRQRFALHALVLVGFAIATRLEPSVLRATAMAGLAAWSAAEGHRQTGLRLLGLAVSALVLIDPFLVHSVGFQLSVAASAGLLVISPAMAERLPGPSIIREPLAITLGAQLAVVPLLVAYFGPVSVASVPANLLAGMVAGFVMIWGLTAGVAAGLTGGLVGAGLQLPARAALHWLDGVAGWAARLPAPLLGGEALAACGLLIVLMWAVRRTRTAPAHLARAAAAFVLVLVLLRSVPQPPLSVTELAGGGVWIPAADGLPSVLVVSADADHRLLDDVVDARIRSADVLVSEAGSGQGRETTRALIDLIAVGRVLAPPQHRIIGGTRVTEPVIVAVGAGELRVRPTAPNRLEVRVPADDGLIHVPKDVASNDGDPSDQG